ncbi:hypothetical protein QVD17_05077 [Tagetes erecta]|uniref:Uncharacterized protein n=1 Tax=Tagetes erecta TaxID=13708 RepID=A0AAD8PB83_TARER|nr:hypothetical protein QVD17_05077 [Tagetes erecta]
MDPRTHLEALVTLLLNVTRENNHLSGPLLLTVELNEAHVVHAFHVFLSFTLYKLVSPHSFQSHISITSP